MSPDYFAYIAIKECEHFIAGVRRRYREGWMQTRFSTYLIAAPQYKNLSYKDMIQFPWEEEEKDTAEQQLTPEEQADRLKMLRAQAEKINQILNRKNGKRFCKTAIR